MISPCIKMCALENDHCKGCGRSKEQIMKWRTYTDKEREEIIQELEKRCE